jgi:hypothetical protein
MVPHLRSARRFRHLEAFSFEKRSQNDPDLSFIIDDEYSFHRRTRFPITLDRTSPQQCAGDPLTMPAERMFDFRPNEEQFKLHQSRRRSALKLQKIDAPLLSEVA